MRARGEVSGLFVLALVLALPGFVGLASAQEPAQVFDVYLDCLGRGDLDGAMGYCALPGSSDPQALRQLRGMMDGISNEVDLLGMTRALSLIVPLSPTPMEWRVKQDSYQTGDEAMLSLSVTTTLLLDQKVYFVRAGTGWQIDLQRTFLENAKGTKIEKMLADQAGEGQARAQLARIGEAMRQYGEANRWVLPTAQTWRDDLLKFDKVVTASDFIAPGETQPSYAINENLAGTQAGQIRDPGRTVLLFDAQPGTSAGGPSAACYRHGGYALVLTAKGEILRTQNASELMWGSRPLGPATGTIAVKPTVKDGKELVPLRDVLTAFGGKLTWKEQGGYSLAEALGHQVEIRPGDTSIKVDGQTVVIGLSAETIDGTLYVPSGLPSRAFGLAVRWTENGIEYR
jgi:hypothetical protein